jgi:hypothetical protein
VEEEVMQTPIEDAFGPVCSPELRRVGSTRVEQVIELGWEEAFLCWVEAFPNRINLNAAVGMIAAAEGVHWLKVSPSEKERARRLVSKLRKTFRDQTIAPQH